MITNERERKMLEAVYESARECLDEAHQASRKNDIRRMHKALLELSVYITAAVNLMSSNE